MSEGQHYHETEKEELPQATTIGSQKDVELSVPHRQGNPGAARDCREYCSITSIEDYSTASEIISWEPAVSFTCPN